MSGMNLLEMIMSAQGGASAQQAGAQLGLSQEQSQGAIAALLPAISSALKQNTANPEGLAGLLGALQKGQHDQYLDNPQAVAQPQAVSEGNAILGHLFGSKDVSRAVAGHAAQKTGMDAGILKKMLPMVAAMAMGSLSKQTRQPSMAQGLAGLALNQVMGGGQKGGLLGGILGSVLGGGQKRQMQQQRQQHQQGLGMLGNLLDADGNGSVMDDVLKMAMKGMMK
jgi:hypothetical protein